MLPARDLYKNQNGKDNPLINWQGRISLTRILDANNQESN